MPKDYSQNFVPLYALCPRKMTQRLTTAKAPGSVWSVVLALKAYAMEKQSCFPSHQTIQDYVGGSLPLRTIRFALKWLEDRNFIKRNSRTSKERYVLYIDKHKPIESKRQSVAAETGNPLPQKRKKENHFSKPPMSPVSQGIEETKEKKAKNYKSKWRSPEERRATKAQRAAARAERQRLEQQEIERCCPVERRGRLQSALGDIAFHQEPRGLLPGDLEHLEAEVEPWFRTLGEIARKDWFNINEIGEEAFLERIYAAIRRL